ncbi:rhombosortase [Pseudidiomarina woesei]|uniref:Rhomboid family GlyGly-CTERM serine protease n=1 Tax=Pseudidiomarina woesei TaxID=1381080 RepID=A0A0K6GV16_9GAMM|nr:rhombosortase [Pseudidiomarina woesei]CUA82611.1 rhomboid family GlyGly-CTERM serine protease [Pseudidiomarina woesei]
MHKINEAIQVIICSLVIAAVAIWLPYYQAETGSLLNQYDFAQALAWQEPWRLLTAHFFHLDARHALYNALGLLMVSVFFARHFDVRTWLNAILVIATLASVLVRLVGIPERFVGLSGVIHGLLMMSLLLEWAKQKYAFNDWLPPLSIALLTLKVVLEITGLLNSQILLSQGNTFGYVHGAGLVAGVVAWRLHRRRLASLTANPNKPTTTESSQE